MNIPFLRKSAPSLLGLDLSEGAIKLVVLKALNNSFELKFCAKLSSTSDLKTELMRCALKNKRIAFAVNHNSVLFKKIDLDKILTEKEVFSQVILHAKQYFNASADELMIDFERLGPSRKNPDLVEIQWAATRKKSIEHALRLTQAHNLHLHIIEPNSFSLQRTALHFSKINSLQKNYVITIHIEKEFLLFTMIHDNKIIHTRSEEYLITSQNFDLNSTIIKITLQILQSVLIQFSEKNLILILLSGPSIPDEMIKIIEEKTEIKSTRINPFSGITVPPSIKNNLQHNIAHEFTISVGLAMRINDAD